MAALFRESSVEVYLTGSRLNTLGAVVPKSVTAKQAEEGFLRSPNPLKIGHYYLVASPGLFTVLQAVDVKITDRKNGLPRKGFGENARATIELSFRYLQPQGKIESLNALLSEARDR